MTTRKTLTAAVSRVDVLHSGAPVHTLAVTGGSVSIDATRPVRSNLACALIDPTRALTRGGAEAPESQD